MYLAEKYDSSSLTLFFFLRRMAQSLSLPHFSVLCSYTSCQFNVTVVAIMCQLKYPPDTAAARRRYGLSPVIQTHQVEQLFVAIQVGVNEIRLWGTQHKTPIPMCVSPCSSHVCSHLHPSQAVSELIPHVIDRRRVLW